MQSDYQRKLRNNPPPPPNNPALGQTPNVRNITDLGTGQLQVTTTPQQVNVVSTTRVGIKLTNLSGTDIFYGATAGVTSSSGDLLPGGRGSWIFIPSRSVIWVVVASGTASMSWAEAYE
jgi:hypothetical protein